MLEGFARSVLSVMFWFGPLSVEEIRRSEVFCSVMFWSKILRSVLMVPVPSILL